MRTLYTLTATLTVLAALGPFSSSLACVWCSDRPISALSYLKEQARYKAEKSSIISAQNDEKFAACHQAVPDYLLKPVVAPQFTSEPPHRFYHEYLCKYFPQAPVMCEVLLPTMCPDGLRYAIQSLVYFISSGNWRYFANDKEALRLEQVHVIILLEQLDTLIKVLKRASIDPQTGLLVLAKEGAQAPSHSAVIAHWRMRGHTEAGDLSALYLDFLVRLAYINVMFQDYANSYLYYERLQRELRLVAGTKYEQTYTQVSRLYAELLKMLRQRLWGADSSSAKNISYALSTTLEQWAEKNKGMEELQSFIHSFVTHYECNVTGKFTHEYHPFLLDRTAQSLVALEGRLTDERMPIVGRLMLMGYEEQGVPRYYTDYTDAYFTDEMTAKTQAGWSLKMFNRFGLLSGFLCKNANLLAQYARTEKNIELPLTHINPELVEIFDGERTLFQEHAFGDAYWPVMNTIKRVEHQLVRMAMPELCRELMHFWQTLYNNELKVTGKQHVVGTQDILFSIAYMRHLQSSAVPILHFYMGPDITYPIETSSLHKKEVTRHAQTFVKKFVPQLTARNGKKTGYIFCSFVDGVGKSTMLGNVQNWMKHGPHIEKYEHVDNSSSQLATVFDFSEDAVIADLPAQVSHFTYKPDGMVYVAIGATDMAVDEREKVYAYVANNRSKLLKAHAQLLEKAGQKMRRGGYDLAKFEHENPELSYAANVILLGKQGEEWFSFTYDGKQYLFDRDDQRSIRVRVPLATAPSHGLKNTCTEQMIFTEGVRFPLSYKNFVQDLINQLHEHGVEQVVMVDFLSMYSRSSRENIRVNYIIQQLALLYSDFSIETSFYQNFVHNAQLLSFFEEKGRVAGFHRTLSYETLVRTALYDVLRDYADDSIAGVDLKTVTDMIRKKVATLPAARIKEITMLVDAKIKGEHASLMEAYGNTREFVAIQQFRADDLVAFSKKLSSIFTKQVQHETLNQWWEKVRDASYLRSATCYHNGTINQTFAELDNHLQVRVIARLPRYCKDRQLLLPALRQVRASWYATLSNLLYTHENSSGLEMVGQKYRIPPVFALYDDQGNVCIVTTMLEPVDREYEMPEYSLFEITPRDNIEDWGVHDDKLYLTNWQAVTDTHGGVFGYGHEPSGGSVKNNDQMAWRTRPIVSVLYHQFARDHGDERVLLHEKLFEKLSEKVDAMKINREQWKREAEQNGEYKDSLPPPRRQDKDEMGKVKQETDVKRHFIRDDQVTGVRLFLRAIATLDMIAKDPEVDLASRRANREDFAANLRTAEWLTLPWLYGLLPKEQLFDRYDMVEPLIKWDALDQ